MSQQSIKQALSSGFEAPRQEIVAGRWYAPTREQAHTDYLNVEVFGWRATRKLPAVTTHIRWEITCTTCGITRIIEALALRASVDGDGKRRIAECKHPAVPLSREACRDAFGLSPNQLLTVMRGVGPEAAFLVRKGWLSSVGTPAVLSSTAKARRELGVTP